MNGWVDKRMNGWIDKRMNGRMNKWMNGQMSQWMKKSINKWEDMEFDTQFWWYYTKMNRWINQGVGWMNICVDVEVIIFILNKTGLIDVWIIGQRDKWMNV